jgi:hypothetical protein
MVTAMLTLNVYLAAAVLAGTALVSAGAGYVVSRATIAGQGTVVCPAPAEPAASPQLPWYLPSGPTPPLNAGKKW